MHMKIVAQLPQHLQFVADSQDVAPIQQAYPEARLYDSFFVDTRDGEYREIWGICGTVPYSSKLTSQIL